MDRLIHVILLPYCQYCGGELPTDASFCSNCGRPLKPEVKTLAPSIPTGEPSRPSSAWYLLPILLFLVCCSWLGGILGYFALKNRDKRMARNVLILGIALTVVFVLVAIAGYVIYEVTKPP